MSGVESRASGGFAAVLEAADVHHPIAIDGENLPPVVLRDRRSAGQVAAHLQPYEDLVATRHGLEDFGPDAGLATALVPLEHLIAVLAWRRRVVGRAPADAITQELADAGDVGRLERIFHAPGQRLHGIVLRQRGEPPDR